MLFSILASDQESIPVNPDVDDPVELDLENLSPSVSANSRSDYGGLYRPLEGIGVSDGGEDGSDISQ